MDLACFFGHSGTNNDINVLNKSYLFCNLENDTLLLANYSIKGINYSVGYFLTDSIYPKWSTLVQTIPDPSERKIFCETTRSIQQGRWAFGVLQAQFAIVRGGARLGNKSTLHDVMKACIIMPNMIVENECNEYSNTYVFDENLPASDIKYENSPIVPEVTVLRNLNNGRYVNWLRAYRQIMNAGEHNELQARLVYHLWDIRGELDD